MPRHIVNSGVFYAPPQPPPGQLVETLSTRAGTPARHPGPGPGGLAVVDKRMGLIRAMPSCRRPVELLDPLVGADRYARLRADASEFRDRFAGRTIWNVNSTTVGGGVAEMLQVLVGYVEDLDIAIRWLVIHGDAEFFALTKRLHNSIHGHGDGAAFTERQARHYAQILAANAVELLERVRPGDVVLLHDPQTAGLAGPLVDAGAVVMWRCHIGLDWTNEATEAAWAFLRPHLAMAHGWVFSRRAYVPAWLPDENVWIIPPSIDPFSTKNQELDQESVRAILATIGVLDDAAAAGVGRLPGAGRAVGDQRGRRPGRRGGVQRLPVAVAGPAASGPVPHAAGDVAARRRGRERRHGERVAAAREHRGAEEPRGGLRADGGRSDVEEPAGDRVRRGWDQRPDRRRHGPPATGSDGPAGVSGTTSSATCIFADTPGRSRSYLRGGRPHAVNPRDGPARTRVSWLLRLAGDPAWRDTPTG
jgi:hypothetical protein